MKAPFWLRRPGLIVRGVFAHRERPDLEALERIEDPEAFVWAILPHAARTFAASIALLPAASALPAAVAYLYCRMLDTYEDLVPDADTRDGALQQFAARLAQATVGAGIPGPAPTIGASNARDARDQAHLLLVRHASRVDHLYATFAPAVQGAIRELVCDMAEGMRWSGRTFAAQGGALTSDEQLLAYCRVVLGNPVVFAVRLVRLGAGASTVLGQQEREDAMQVGELVQLANVTRDIEKDLARGIAYDASLAAVLRHPDAMLDAALKALVGATRARLMRLALDRGPAYARMLAAMGLPRLSLARSSAVLLLLFTERYWRHCASRCGAPTWAGTDSTFALLARALPALGSARHAAREVSRVERAFAAAAADAADHRAPRALA